MTASELLSWFKRYPYLCIFGLNMRSWTPTFIEIKEIVIKKGMKEEDLFPPRKKIIKILVVGISGENTIKFSLLTKCLEEPIGVILKKVAYYYQIGVVILEVEKCGGHEFMILAPGRKVNLRNMMETWKSD